MNGEAETRVSAGDDRDAIIDNSARRDEGDAGAAARHARSATFNELTPDKPDVPGLSSGLSPWTGGRIWESSRHLADYLAALGKDDWGRYFPTPPSPLFLGRFAPVLRRFSAVPLRCPASWRRDGENGRKMAENGRNLGEKRARNSGG